MSHTTTEPRRSWTSKMLIAAAVLLFAVGTPWLIIDITGRRALRRVLTNLRAQDAALTSEELHARRAQVPDSQNSGMFLRSMAPELDALTDENDPLVERLPLIGKGNFPAFAEEWPAALIADLDSFLSNNEELLSKLTALTQMARGRLDHIVPMGSMSFPTRGFVRTAAKCANLGTLAHAARGDIPETQRYLLIALHIGRISDDEPSLISTLVGVACDQRALTSIEYALSLVPFETAFLAHLDDELRRIEESESLWWGMQSERVLIRSIIHLYRQNPNLMRSSGGGPPITPSRFLRGFSYLEEAKALEMVSTVVDAARSPTKAIVSANAYEAACVTLPRYYAIIHILPSVSRAITLWVNNLARARCARVALAAERYRLDRGEWPSKLDQLVPDYLDTLQLDPFNDKPLLYTTDERMITIYSVGEDKTDDQGMLEVTPEDPRRPPDVGFRLLHPELRGLRISKNDEP
ncbi:MAG: hypothetical protein IID39_00195 [Planctomycetes bacterium]|nr:hypothetical protein [Planctomycetota bacterium]